MTKQEMPFYNDNVYVEEFDYTVVDENEAPLLEQREGIVTRLAGGVAAFACGGLIVFGPIGLVGPTGNQGLLAEHVVVRLKSSEPAPNATDVLASDAHRASAESFRKMFKVVPLNPVEELDEPDYGF